MDDMSTDLLQEMLEERPCEPPIFLAEDGQGSDTDEPFI